jgi:hypothetical protein
MEISRFPSKRFLRMPGSTTTRGQHASCDIDTGCVAFCWTENISAPNLSYAAQYLACALPCERFTSALADIRASLGAGAVRYSFTVTDFHRLPLAGLPAHPSTSSRRMLFLGFARLALDGVSWIQGGSVEGAVGQEFAAATQSAPSSAPSLGRRSLRELDSASCPDAWAETA